MNALVQRDEPSLPAVQATTPSQLLALAVQQGADLDRLEKLMALQERWEANEARKAYTTAMAAFKAEPLRIFKDKRVSFSTSKGLTEYEHATLGNVVQTIIAGLAKHGLSHSWDVKRADARVRVSCKITHSLGHSESIELEAGLDDSGSKNNIQAMGSTITYLQRYTLLSITGLATEDQDDDGQSAEPAPQKLEPVERTSPHVKLSEFEPADQDRLKKIAAGVEDTIIESGARQAMTYIDTQNLGADEKSALWGLLKKSTKTALKDAHAR